MSTNRHRRTRIYGINFDIGERYYKKQLDDLNNKSTFPRVDLNSSAELLSKDEKSTPKVSFASFDPIREESRPRFTSHDTNSYAERRSQSKLKTLDNTDNDAVKILRSRTPINIQDDDVDEFISKVRNKKMSRRICFDEFDDDLPLDFMKKITFDHKQDNNSTNGNNNSYVSKFLKHKLSQDVNNEKKITTIGLKLKSEDTYSEQKTRDELAALQRAQETRARLLNLETEMEASNKKNKEREKRKETLRKYLISSESS